MKNIKILASLLLTVGIVSVQAVPVQMPGGNWYDLVVSPGIGWVDADAAAIGAGGHLVTITSQDEDNFVLRLIYAWQAAGASIQPSEFWAGGFQEGPNASSATEGWTWVNGEGAFPGVNGGSGYSNWADSEPNDVNGPGTEQYLGLGLLEFMSPATWNDEGNPGLIAGYVVEYERNGVPEGGAGLAGLLAIAGLFAVRRTRKAS